MYLYLSTEQALYWGLWKAASNSGYVGYMKICFISLVEFFLCVIKTPFN